MTGTLIVALVAVAVGVLVATRSSGEDRVASLEQQLRCPVCKSVSIAESPSATAASMRRIVQSQVAQGRTDAEVIGYFTARYGQWVVLSASPKGATLPLWLFVGASAAVGAVVLLNGRRRGRRSAAKLTAADRGAVQAALTNYPSEVAEPAEPGHAHLAEIRDLALRDLVDLDRQVTAQEVSAEDAAELRQRYEREALAALDGLKSLPVLPARDSDGPRLAAPRLVTSRRVLYAAGLALSVLAAFLVQQNLLDRPSGGFVTGNEMLQPASAPRDLSKVTDAELEAVVAANPDIVGMRLALARRYLDEGRYDLAVVHYKKVLDKEPNNPEALAYLGWVMLRLGRPEQAAKLVDTAVAVDPRLADAWWVQANVRLYGLKDPKAAIDSLDRLRGLPDLGSVVQRQVVQLRAKAVRLLQRRR